MTTTNASVRDTLEEYLKVRPFRKYRTEWEIFIGTVDRDIICLDFEKEEWWRSDERESMELPPSLPADCIIMDPDDTLHVAESARRK